MDKNNYLINEISKIIPTLKENHFLRAYNKTRTKRFIMQSAMAFFFQYLTIIYLTLTYPACPLYPPIGSAFVILFILGGTSCYGLILGGLCAYLFHGLSWTSTLLYLCADIVCAYLGVLLCRNTFSSDISMTINTMEWLKFIRNIAIVTFISGLLRTGVIIFNSHNQWPFKFLFYNFIDFWMADLNAIIVFSAFLLSWIALHFSREKISTVNLHKVFIFQVVLFILLSILFMKKLDFVFFMLFAMGVGLYYSYKYGFFIATALNYVITILFLAYFMLHQVFYLHYFGMPVYCCTPVVLLIFILAMIFLGQKKNKLSKML